jgi:hypothetical protein
MFYETVYETGKMSVASYEDDAEAQRAIEDHHRRALNGESGGPLGQPAERIRAVYVYDEHPNEFNVEQTFSAEVAGKEMDRLIKEVKDKNGVVAIDELATRVRDLSHPMVDVQSGEPFQSYYKMKEKKQLNLNFLEGGVQ